MREIQALNRLLDKKGAKSWPVISSLWRGFNQLQYNWVSKLAGEDTIQTLNYGFDDGTRITLDPEDEPHRYGLQMYHFVATSVSIKNKKVLEVGSGRGGGARYVARYLGPRKIIAVDLSPEAIKFAQKYQAYPNLEFRVGDAQNLDFPNSSFDAVLNVESSHSYGNVPEFLSEVYRVLRPGGHFLFADLRLTTDVPVLEQQFKDAGFNIVKKQDITENMLRSLDATNAAKLKILKENVPSFLHAYFASFAGMQGTIMYESYVTGERQYWHYLCQKASRRGKT